MGDKYQKVQGTIDLFTRQQPIVLETVERDGCCFSKEEFIKNKYVESAEIFLAGYRWYVKEAAKLVAPPREGCYPYWVYAEPMDAESSGGGTLLQLRVPLDEAVFFDSADWFKILNLSYIGENAADEKKFKDELRNMGLDAGKVMLGNFYPDLKKKITDSWQRLFRHHESVKNGDYSDIHSIEAGLWTIKKEWIVQTW